MKTRPEAALPAEGLAGGRKIGLTGIPAGGMDLGMASRLGLSGLYLFAGFAGLGVAPALFGLGLLVMAAVLHPRAWREPLPRGALILPLLTLYWALSALWGMALLPGEAQWHAFKDLLWLLAFVPIAWWLRGDEERLQWTGMLALAGFLLGMATHFDKGILQGARTGFQFGAVPFGLYCGTALLGLLLFPPKRGWVWPIWMVALAILTEGLLLSQARSAWLASALVFPVALAFRYSLRSSKRARLAVVLGAAVAGGAAFAHWPLLKARLALPASTQALVEGHVEDDNSLAISHRLWLWRLGIERWQEHPFLGWGIGASASLLALSPLRFQGQEPFAHFHNTYLALLVEQGLWGFALDLALVGMVVGGFLRQGVPRPLGIFLLGALAMWLIWNFFDTRLTHADGRFYWLLLMGAMYSFTFRKT